MNFVSDYPLAQSGVWTSGAAKPSKYRLEPGIMHSASISASESWLRQNDKFITHDTTTISNLYPFMDASVYVDWNRSTIVIEYDAIFGFDIDLLDRRKFKLFPTDRSGKVNKKWS